MGRSSSVQEWWRLFTCSYWNLFSTLKGGNRSAFVYFGNSFPFFFSLGDPSPTGDQGYFGEKRSCFTPSLSLSSPSSWLTTLWVFSPLFFIFLIDSWILLKIWKQKQKTLKEQRDCVCVCAFLCFHGLIGTGAGQHGGGFGWMYRRCLGAAGAEEEENRKTVPAALLAAGCSHHSARWVGGVHAWLLSPSRSVCLCVSVRAGCISVCECACVFAHCCRPNDNWHICCASLLALEPRFWPGLRSDHAGSCMCVLRPWKVWQASACDQCYLRGF